VGAETPTRIVDYSVSLPRVGIGARLDVNPADGIAGGAKPLLDVGVDGETHQPIVDGFYSPLVVEDVVAHIHHVLREIDVLVIHGNNRVLAIVALGRDVDTVAGIDGVLVAIPDVVKVEILEVAGVDVEQLVTVELTCERITEYH